MFSREENQLIYNALEAYKASMVRSYNKATHPEVAQVFKKASLQCEVLMEKMELTV